MSNLFGAKSKYLRIDELEHLRDELLIEADDWLSVTQRAEDRVLEAINRELIELDENYRRGLISWKARLRNWTRLQKAKLRVRNARR